MRSTISLITRLRSDFPDISFEESDISRWSHSQRTIFFNPNEEHADWIILHELGHACLKHNRYVRDIELIAMERDAWQYAIDNLSAKYKIIIDNDFIEDHIDTYRDWLHAKATCPACSLSGIEKKRHTYYCPSCTHTWRTNEGTQVRIQRYSKKVS